MSLTGIAFALVFFAGLGLAFARHPIYGLYTYVAVFYLHPPSRWWGESLPDLRWALLAAAVTFLASMRLPEDKSRPSWMSTTPAKLLIAYTLLLWVQNLWALDAEEQMTVSVLFTKYLLLIFLVWKIIDTPEKVKQFLMAHILGCAYLGWLAFNARVSGRLEGVGGPGIDEANALAMQMGTAVAVGSMFVLGLRDWMRWAAMLALPFCLNTMVLAGSRGAFVALLACGMALWYLKPMRHRGLFYAFAFLGLLLFGMLASQTFLARVSTITAATQEDAVVDRSAESRLVIIKAQWEMFKDHPMGAGHRGTAVLSTDYLDERYMSRSKVVNGQRVAGQRSSHNTFMTTLTEQGFIGAFLYMLLWLWAVRTLMKMRTRETDPESTERALLTAAIGGGLAMVFVAGMFVDYLKAEVQIWLFTLLAVMWQMRQPATASVTEPRRRARSARPAVHGSAG